MKVLLVESNLDISDFIRTGFEQEAITLDIADNGKDGLFFATTELYDLIIIDRTLQDIQSSRIVRTIRANEVLTPILILSVPADVNELIKILDAGSDDFLIKPFTFSELKARIYTLLRRSSFNYTSEVSELQVGDLSLNLLSRKAIRCGEVIELKPREFRLLAFLMRHEGQVVTRTMLLEQVWDYYFDPQTNIIDVHISRIRQKIDKQFSRPLIQTVRGAGYVIQNPQ